jgi:hypothetical protein
MLAKKYSDNTWNIHEDMLSQLQDDILNSIHPSKIFDGLFKNTNISLGIDSDFIRNYPNEAKAASLTQMRQFNFSLVHDCFVGHQLMQLSDH